MRVPGAGKVLKGRKSQAPGASPLLSILASPSIVLRLVGVRGADPSVPGPSGEQRHPGEARPTVRGPSSGNSLKAGLLCGPRASGPLLSAGCYRHNDGH